MAAIVSVIIPCYNQAQFLSATIESVLRQTYRNFEIIVVDDGSTDGVAEVAARYADVRLIRQPNRGVSVARNTGLRESVGEYLVFLDSDDVLLPDALKLGIDSLEARPDAAFVYGYGQFIGADGSRLPTPRQPKIKRDYYRQMLRQNYIWSVGAVVFRRSFVDGFSLGMDGCSDWDLFLRIVKDYEIYCHGKIVFQYRRHDSNMSSNREEMTSATLSVFKSQLEVVRGNRKLEKLCKAQIAITERELAGKRDLTKIIINRITNTIRIRTRLRSLLR